MSVSARLASKRGWLVNASYSDEQLAVFEQSWAELFA